jgi:hypothetical protein
MKKLLGISFTFLLLCPFLLTIFSPETMAQEKDVETEREVEIEDVEGLRVELNQYTQDPHSKRVKFEMVLLPTVNSDRVRITWEISGTSTVPDVDEMDAYLTTQTPEGKKSKSKISYLKAVSEYGKTYVVYGNSSEFKVTSGNIYYIEIYVIPTGYGLSELVGRAEAFRAEGNLIVSASKLYGSNATGEILPITDDYKKAKNINLVTQILKALGGTVIVLLILFVAAKWFIKWLNRDDVAEYERKNPS